MQNKEIREMAKKNGIPLWKIAYKAGISEATIIRWLRFELSEEKRQMFLDIIADIVAEQKQAKH